MASGGKVTAMSIVAQRVQRPLRGLFSASTGTHQFNGAARSLYDTVGELTSFVVYEHLTG